MRLFYLWVGVIVFALPVSAAAVEEPKPNCGPYCLYVAARLLGNDVGTFEQFYKRFEEPDGRGYSLGKLEAVAQSLDLKTYGVQTSAEILALRPGRFACIAWISGQHFVLIHSIDQGQLMIIDPPSTYPIPIEVFRTKWDGQALLISPDELLTDEELIWRSGRSKRWGVAAVVALTLAGLTFGAMRRRRDHAA